MNDPYEAFVDTAYIYLRAQQDTIWTIYHIDDYDKYYYDQYTAQITFIRNETVVVVADFQVAGSISTHSNTWLWSWANPSLEASVTCAAIEVRQYGEAQHFSELITAQWVADETDGWAMAAVTAYITKAEAVYRCPSDNGFLFLVLTNVRWMPPLV